MVLEIGLEIFFLCREISHLRIKFWEINTIVASYLVALVTLEIGLCVDFGHLFNNKFWTVKNFSKQAKSFIKQTFWVWIWLQILNFLDENRENYCCLNIAHRVTRNSEFNYMPIERCKNGSITFCSRNWLWISFSYVLRSITSV